MSMHPDAVAEIARQRMADRRDRAEAARLAGRVGWWRPRKRRTATDGVPTLRECPGLAGHPTSPADRPMRLLPQPISPADHSTRPPQDPARPVERSIRAASPASVVVDLRRRTPVRPAEERAGHPADEPADEFVEEDRVRIRCE